MRGMSVCASASGFPMSAASMTRLCVMSSCVSMTVALAWTAAGDGAAGGVVAVAPGAAEAAIGGAVSTAEGVVPGAAGAGAAAPLLDAVPPQPEDRHDIAQ